MQAAPQPGTRERILDAAFDLVSEGGIGAVTNRALAAKASVSLGSITYHFESQDQILRETLQRFVEGEAQRLEALNAAQQHNGSPEASLAAVQELLSGDTARRLAKIDLYLVAARRPEVRLAAERCFAAYDAIVESGLRAAGIDPTPVVVKSIVALIDGLQLRRLALGDTDDLPVVEALSLLVRGAAAND